MIDALYGAVAGGNQTDINNDAVGNATNEGIAPLGYIYTSDPTKTIGTAALEWRNSLTQSGCLTVVKAYTK